MGKTSRNKKNRKMKENNMKKKNSTDEKSAVLEGLSPKASREIQKRREIIWRRLPIGRLCELALSYSDEIAGYFEEHILDRVREGMLSYDKAVELTLSEAAYEVLRDGFIVCEERRFISDSEFSSFLLECVNPPVFKWKGGGGGGRFLAMAHLYCSDNAVGHFRAAIALAMHRLMHEAVEAQEALDAGGTAWEDLHDDWHVEQVDLAA